MERFALFRGFWAIWLIPTGVVLISLLLASLPAPKNVDKLVGEGAKASGFQRGLQGVLRGISRVTYGRPARITTVLVALFAVGSIYTALQIRIGNPVAGSSLLWHDSEYNEAVRQINAHFPGVNRSEEHTSELQSLMRIS